MGTNYEHLTAEERATVKESRGKNLRPFPDFAGKGRFAFGEQLTLHPLLSRAT
jgi:hypothetical protein